MRFLLPMWILGLALLAPGTAHAWLLSRAWNEIARPAGPQAVAVDCPACPPGKVQDPNTCQCRCPAAFFESNGGCEECRPGRVKLMEDPQNCGACGHACAAGQSCCQGSCRSLARDSENCGACGRRCADGKSCQSGDCVAR